MLKLFMNVFADSGQKFGSTARHDPYREFNFRVTITGKKVFTKVGFQKVTGIKLKTDIIEYREGADKQLAPHKLAGLIKHDPITMERGMSQDTDMVDWLFQQVTKANDDQFKCTVIIEMMDRDNKTSVKKYELLEAWISDYETGDLDANGNAIAIDRMVVQFEGVRINGKLIQ
jgi:phage tail-like protein